MAEDLEAILGAAGGMADTDPAFWTWEAARGDLKGRLRKTAGSLPSDVRSGLPAEGLVTWRRGLL